MRSNNNLAVQKIHIGLRLSQSMVKKGKGSPYSITEDTVPELTASEMTYTVLSGALNSTPTNQSRADPGFWQSACRWRES